MPTWRGDTKANTITSICSSSGWNWLPRPRRRFLTGLHRQSLRRPLPKRLHRLRPRRRLSLSSRPQSLAFPARAAGAKVPVPNNEKPKLAEEENLRRSHPGRAHGPWSAGASIPPEIKVKNPKGNREYLLFIEDEPQVAALAAEMLTDEGYKVIMAKDGFEALEIYRKIGKQIGLVILDFFLPVMDGDAVFDELQALNPKVNVVLSSGFAEQSKISAMLGQGLRGFIPKPYSREKLLAQVRSTLDAAREAVR